MQHDVLVTYILRFVKMPPTLSTVNNIQETQLKCPRLPVEFRGFRAIWTPAKLLSVKLIRPDNMGWPQNSWFIKSCEILSYGLEYECLNSNTMAIRLPSIQTAIKHKVETISANKTNESN